MTAKEIKQNNVKLYNTMKTEKQKWVDDVLAYSDTIKPVNASDGLWGSIYSRVLSSPMQISIVPIRTVWMAAASMAILIVLNMAIIAAQAQVGHRGDTSIYRPYSLTGSFNLY